MPMFNLIRYGSITETSQERQIMLLAITDSKSFKVKITGNTKDFEVAVPSIYLKIFWKALEVLSSNCEINLIVA